MNKKQLLLLSLFSISTSLSAQESMFQMGWSLSVPVGETETFINPTSSRGVVMGGRKFLFDFFSIGGQASWQVFDGVTTGYSNINESTDITGKQYRYINAFPLMFNSHFYFGTDGGIRPYLGSAVGLSIVNTRTDFGLYRIDDTTLHFAVAPEFGFIIPIGVAGAGLNFAVKYEQAFKSTNDMHIQYLSFNLSFAFLN